MPTTPNMLLLLPVPTVTLGPLWASEINAALTLVDSHDHTTGKGQRVPTNGININANLPFNDWHLNSVKSTRYNDNASALIDPNDVRNIYAVNGDLYYNNGTGTPIQITSGTSVLASSDGITRAYEQEVVGSSPLTIHPSDTFSLLSVESNAAAITINLPSCAAVQAGRIYTIADVDGNAAVNNITIVPNGSDTINNVAANKVLSVNSQYIQMVSDGTNNWISSDVVEVADNTISTAKLQDLAVTTAKIDNLAVTAAKMAANSVATTNLINGAVTPQKRSALGQQISASCGSYSVSNSTTSFTNVTNLSVTITTTGRPVFVGLISDATDQGGQSGCIIVTVSAAQFRIRRGSTDVYHTSLNVSGGTAKVPSSSIYTIDTPAAGTYTYTFAQATVSGSTGRDVLYSKLVAYEL
jgi:hypothetical protein